MRHQQTILRGYSTYVRVEIFFTRKNTLECTIVHQTGALATYFMVNKYQNVVQQKLITMEV